MVSEDSKNVFSCGSFLFLVFPADYSYLCSYYTIDLYELPSIWLNVLGPTMYYYIARQLLAFNEFILRL